jgi:hypothetical protein
MPRVELLLTGPRAPIPEATSNTMAALAEIVGQELLRAAEGLLTAVAPPRIPKGMPEEISLSLGLITAEHLEEWLLIHNEQNTRLGMLLGNTITAAPNWLSQVRAQAKLTPVIGHSTWVENSSITIHFAQTMTTIVPLILDRTLTRHSVLRILNKIITTALPELEPFEIKDINYFAYQKQTGTPTQRKNHRQGVEGLITLERRPNTPLTMDILADTMLALHIGNDDTIGHTTRQRLDEPSIRPPRSKMAPKMGKKPSSPASEGPTQNPGLPREEPEAWVNLPPRPPTPQHHGARHHPH